MHRQALKHLVVFGTACGLGLGAAAARADDEGIKTTFSGFGTLAAVFTDQESMQFTDDPAKFKGAGTRIDTGLDSRLGLQGVVKFSPEFSFVAQAVASRIGVKDYDIHAEWLYGQYTPLSGVDLRLGRVVLPTFMISDTRNVGYAQTWLRAPTDLYASHPLTNLDGVQGAWRVNAGPVTLTSQVSYGSNTTDVNAGGLPLSIKAEDTLNVSFTAEISDWTARVAQTKLNAPAVDIGGGLYDIKDKFLTAGLQYDNGTAVVLAEWARRRGVDVANWPAGPQPLLNSTAWYVAAGYRFGKLTPMVRYSEIKREAGIIDFPKKPVVGASLRYDVARNVDLKLQIDRYDSHSFYGFVVPTPATTAAGTKVNVVSFGADFVF